MTRVLSGFKKPLIIGHRGYRGKYPENTLAGFKAAIDAGADMIEFDVRLSLDGHPVVIHDALLERTTDGAGPVCAKPLRELKKHDAGGWFHPRFKDETLPTLDEVLGLVNKRVLINIEIKVDANQSCNSYEGIEEKVMDSVLRHNVCDYVLVSSFNRNILEKLRLMKDPPAIGVLSEFGEEKEGLAACRTLDAFSWHPYYLALDKEQVAWAHENGFKVICYTVNEPADIRKLIEMGVDGLFTDDPVAAKKTRDSSGDAFVKSLISTTKDTKSTKAYKNM